ncbi:tetratricopeptide repeat protein [Novosphingobium sp. YJ-S2-02]|uniref:Tetratricopeptide repeat protein n=1 Tax=Novosphingobium aureum TaxID=2792964 RepID=A0A931ML53_9SPHN|nr:tetratricopeptide repeat protein [Novosphingobium aureum]MBH0113110.1 tetratricopeptide repeat protein [Novosphingobium aureum]
MIERLARFTLPLVALAGLAACSKSPEELYAKAQADFAAQDYQAARLEVASALRDDPGNRAMLDLLIRAHLRLGDPDGAQGAIERFERAGGPARELAVYKASVALMRGRAQEALALLGDDRSAPGWVVRAEAKLALGDEEGAVEAFEQGLDAGGDVHLAEGYARYRLLSGDVDGAAAIYKRMQAMDAKAYETMVLGADIFAAKGKPAEAAKAFEAVTAAFPQKLPPLLALANQYDMLGKVDAAMEVIEKAQKLAPGNGAVEDLRIQLLAEKGEWEKIRLAMQGQESRLEPGSGTQMKYAEALLRLGKAEEARLLFKRAVLALPGNPYAQLMLGEAELEAGNAAQAWQTLEPLAMGTLADDEEIEAGMRAARAAGAPEAKALAARLDPAKRKAEVALVDEGQAALMQQDWSKVRDVYAQLLTRGEDGEVLRRLAMASAALGDHDAAIGYADRALGRARDNPEFLFMAGMVRLEAGRDLASARRLIESAARADPGNAEIARALEKANAATSRG